MLVSGKARLSLRPLQLGCLWAQFRRLFRWRIFERRGLGLLGLAVPMSGKMMCQHPF
jgi:hypothetical protein